MCDTPTSMFVASSGGVHGSISEMRVFIDVFKTRTTVGVALKQSDYPHLRSSYSSSEN